MQVGSLEQASPVSNARQQRILAALVVAGRSGLTVDQLVDRVWDPDETPSTPVPTLRTYVRRLRGAAGDADGELIATRPGGYALVVDEDDVDLHRFARLVTSAGRELDADLARRLVDEALALWRGEPFGELGELSWAAGETARLHELYAVGQELQLSLRLEHGADDVIAEAARLVDRDPYRERLVAIHALALYRAGRQAEALAALADHRRLLADELGVDPSAEVRDLEVAILRQEPSLASSAASGRRLRGYRLGRRIGAGAHSVVYRATQPSVDRDVAIKVVRRELANDPAFIRRFAGEAQTVARLSHPHIVPLHDFWREADQAFLVMRWVEGGSLEAALASGPLEVHRAARIVAEVAAALDFAHRRGVVHRDVKPSNVLLDADDNAYLCDFGIALADQPDTDFPDRRSVGSPAFAAPEQFDGAPAAPAADVYALGVLLYASLTGSPPWPEATDTRTLAHRHRHERLPRVHSADAPVDAALAEVIDRATAKVPRARYPTAGAMAADLAAVVATAPLPLSADVVNPFRGLAAFGEPDAERFFGRAALATEIVDRLEAQTGVLVVGPSGCGKSSLLHAGVVPLLRDGATVTTMVPGADPLSALEQALRMIATQTDVDPVALLRAGASLGECVRATSPGDSVVIVVDQFEELFTLCSPGQAEAFLSLLAGALADHRTSCRLLMAVRADFFDRPLDSPAFGAHVRSTVHPMPPMTADELVSAIVEPVRGSGVEFTERVVARLVADVADRPASLPILQFVLTEMFEHRSGDRLDLADYDRVGGLTGALAGAAERHFETLSPDEREGVRRLMSRLVAVDDEATRRREPRSEVEAVSGVSAGLVDNLVDARLLTLDRQPASREPTVELVHEALLDAWPRLRRWVDDDRAALAAASRLRADAAAWAGQDRDPELLYGGARLAAAEQMATEGAIGLSEQERDFVRLAVERRDEAVRAARDRAAAEARRRRRRRVLATATVLALLGGALAALVGFDAARRADEDRAASRYTELVGTSRSLQDTRTDLALLLAAEAYAQDPGPRAQAALLGAVRRLDGTAEVWAEPRFDIGTAQGGCVSIPEPGSLLVQPNTFSEGGPQPRGSVVQIDLLDREVVRLEDRPVSCHVRRSPAAVDDPTGPRFVGETLDGQIHVMSASGTALATIPGWSGPLFGADGELIAKQGPADRAGRYFALDAETGRRSGQALFAGQEAWLSPGGTQLVVVGPVGEGNFAPTQVDLVDASTYDVIETLSDVVPASPPAWGPDDRLVAFGDERGNLTVWRTDSGAEVLRLPNADASLVAVSPDETTVAVSTGAGMVEFRTLADGRLVGEVDPGQQVLMEMEWVDSSRLAVLGSGGVVSVLSRAEGGLGERSVSCCAPDEFSSIHPDGRPEPFAYYGSYETGMGRFLDLGTQETSAVDMSSHVFDPWALELRLPDRHAVLFRPDGDVLAVDDSGKLTRRRSTPVRHWPDDVPQVAVLRHTSSDGATQLGVLGMAQGEPRAIDALDVAKMDASTLEVVGEPVRIDLAEPASYATVREEGYLAIEFVGQSATRYQFRDLDGGVLVEVDLPRPVGWAALTQDHRYVVAARSSDDSLRVVDAVTGETTVLPVNTEPQGPQMLAGNRFLLQTREGQYEMWEAAGAERIGALVDPGPYAHTQPTVTPDESDVWIVLDGSWTRIPIQPDAWLSRACALAGRALTEQEWRDFVPGDQPYRDACATAG